MRPAPSEKLEQCRITRHAYLSSTAAHGNNGAFWVRGPKGAMLNIIASDKLNWDHVSVSVDNHKRCPTWDEMCFVKDLFWGEDEMVVQYHPAKADYVNCHAGTLHMWKPQVAELPKPPTWMVGPK